MPRTLGSRDSGHATPSWPIQGHVGGIRGTRFADVVFSFTCLYGKLYEFCYCILLWLIPYHAYSDSCASLLLPGMKRTIQRCIQSIRGLCFRTIVI